MAIKNFTINFDKEYFPDTLCVEWLDGKRWRLISSFSYHRDNGEIITVPENFITDFGSKPQISWFLTGSPTDEASPAYIIHDFCCANPEDYPISKADYIFLEAMKILEVPLWKRWVMYIGVRMFHLFQK